MAKVHFSMGSGHGVNRIASYVAGRAALVALAAMLAGPAHAAAVAVAPFAATPMSVVDEMLKLAKVGPDDYVIDLGSGDGRLVLQAVARFGARGGFGVDIEPSLVDYANRKAAEMG